MSHSVRPFLFSLSIVLAGLNLRPILASVSPLMDVIQENTGLNDSLASLLTTVPVVLMGVCLLGATRLRRVLTDHNDILVGLILIFLASIARAFAPGSAQLLITAIAGGIGIAIVQALMPIVIRTQRRQRSASLMGIYSTAIMGGALVASGAAPWISDLCSWQIALSVWAIPAIIAIILWVRLWRRSGISIFPATRKPVQESPRLGAPGLLWTGHRRLHAGSRMASTILHAVGVVGQSSRGDPRIADRSGSGSRNCSIFARQQNQRSALDAVDGTSLAAGRTNLFVSCAGRSCMARRYTHWLWHRRIVSAFSHHCSRPWHQG